MKDGVQKTPDDWVAVALSSVIFVRAMAHVGGVGHPVPTRDPLPRGCDAYVDAEQAGEKGGWKLGGKLGQRAVACLSGMDAEDLEPVSKVPRADGAARLAAGEQPRRGAVGTGGGVSVLLGREVGHQLRERIWQDDGHGPEAKPHRPIGGVEAVDGQSGDRRGLLSVEKNEEAGDTVSCVEGVVVKKASGDIPAGVVIGGGGGPLPTIGREDEGGQALLGRPADEVARMVVVDAFSAREPPFEISLAGGRECQVLTRQPVEQRDRSTELLAHGDQLSVGDGLSAFATAQSAQ